jgi:phosphocarrier protein
MNGELGARAVVTITHPTGLHARPAVKFTKLAKTYAGADIKLRAGNVSPASGAGPWIDAKSIVRVMALKLRSGAMLELQATGSNAEAAVAALKGLVERDFDEGSEA